jgi:hypothetical protein
MSCIVVPDRCCIVAFYSKTPGMNPARGFFERRDLQKNQVSSSSVLLDYAARFLSTSRAM